MPSDVQAAHRLPPNTGVLLINLGTPEAPTAPAIRRYLRQFLSDRRVVEIWRPLWLLILHGVVLPLRPRKLVHSYNSIWSQHGSPLLHYSQRQRAALETELSRRLGAEVPVALGMTYGEPSVAAALEELGRRQVRRVAVLPLYAQYSATSTAAALDAVYAVLKRLRWPPELRTLNSYHDDAGYIDALAQSLRAHWQSQGRAAHLLMSFHSIPQRNLRLGDPYFCQCEKTARLLAERLELKPGEWSVSYQSRLGNQPWLQPYTDLAVKQLAQRGVESLDVICPGFAADCLETLEEVALRYRDDFLAAGGKRYRYVPALNDSPVHIAMLSELLLGQLRGWTLQAGSAEDDSPARLQRVARAEAQLKSPTLL
jgi:ferrochelatase